MEKDIITSNIPVAIFAVHTSTGYRLNPRGVTNTAIPSIINTVKISANLASTLALENRCQLQIVTEQ